MHVVPGGNYTHHQFTQELSGFIACCLVQLPVGHTMIPRRSHPNRHTTFMDRNGHTIRPLTPQQAHGLGNIPMDSLRNPRHVNTMISGLYDVWSYRVNTMISGLYDFNLVALTPWFQDCTTSHNAYYEAWHIMTHDNQMHIHTTTMWIIPTQLLSTCIVI